MSELESIAAAMVIQYTERLDPEPTGSFQMKAADLAHEIELESTVNRSPSMIAAGCVYLTSLARGADYTQEEVSGAFDCTELGLRMAYKDIAGEDGWEIDRPEPSVLVVESTNGRVLNGGGGKRNPDKNDESRTDRIVRFFGAIQDSVTLSSEAEGSYSNRTGETSESVVGGSVFDTEPVRAETEDKYEAIEQACLELHAAGVDKARCQDITDVTNEILEERGFRAILRNPAMARFLSAGKFERWSEKVNITHEREPPGAGWWHIDVTEVSAE